mmetsp:Transcript_100230/g.313201  ORF Transcript_100230/g.313201 Transcript_100230/m.313201 type:complete len:204 (+) Transcript_100230:295-906(+)
MPPKAWHCTGIKNMSGSPLSCRIKPYLPLFCFTAPALSMLCPGPGPGWPDMGWASWLWQPARKLSRGGAPPPQIVVPVKPSSSVTFSARCRPVFLSTENVYTTRVPTGGISPPKSWHCAGMTNMSSSALSCRMKPNLPLFTFTTPATNSSGEGAMSTWPMPLAWTPGWWACASWSCAKAASRGSSACTSSALGFPVFGSWRTL